MAVFGKPFGVVSVGNYNQITDFDDFILFESTSISLEDMEQIATRINDYIDYTYEGKVAEQIYTEGYADGLAVED